ncbi:unnamed protein product [Vitrella brassicaformis CCMP3155]|uniref:Uncharacterized protein n=1 Tax=Vitrella brassicaformis (strain CCMP3155) TaxID=1169540 RepID=A0A0G4EU24_VITBC|nr:unnamed protein product [Vitrella brassicaformis CCMP3155]|eukprot:CEM01765.1 unnamed protein product [Vitrella brassicaformis CCMP3155]
MGRRDTSFEFEVREEERSVQVGFPNAADGAEPQDPDPLVIDLMPLDAFPNAYRFEVNHEKGSVIGSKLVTRMPACVTGVCEGGLAWGDRAEQLPTITRLDVSVLVPRDLGDGDAAGEFGIACVKSLLKIRGIKVLKLCVQSGAFKRLVEERTNGDTVEGLEGRFEYIAWNVHNTLMVKPHE